MSGRRSARIDRISFLADGGWKRQRREERWPHTGKNVAWVLEEMNEQIEQCLLANIKNDEEQKFKGGKGLSKSGNLAAEIRGRRIDFCNEGDTFFVTSARDTPGLNLVNTPTSESNPLFFSIIIFTSTFR